MFSKRKAFTGVPCRDTLEHVHVQDIKCRQPSSSSRKQVYPFASSSVLMMTMMPTWMTLRTFAASNHHSKTKFSVALPSFGLGSVILELLHLAITLLSSFLPPSCLWFMQVIPSSSPSLWQLVLDSWQDFGTLSSCRFLTVPGLVNSISIDNAPTQQRPHHRIIGTLLGTPERLWDAVHHQSLVPELIVECRPCYPVVIPIITHQCKIHPLQGPFVRTTLPQHSQCTILCLPKAS